MKRWILGAVAERTAGWRLATPWAVLCWLVVSSAAFGQERKGPDAARYFDIPVGAQIVLSAKQNGRTVELISDVTANRATKAGKVVTIRRRARRGGKVVLDLVEKYHLSPDRVVRESRNGARRTLIRGPLVKGSTWSDDPRRTTYTVTDTAARLKTPGGDFADVLIVQLQFEQDGAKRTTLHHYVPGAGLVHYVTVGGVPNPIRGTLKSLTLPPDDPRNTQKKRRPLMKRRKLLLD